MGNGSNDPLIGVESTDGTLRGPRTSRGRAFAFRFNFQRRLEFRGLR